MKRTIVGLAVVAVVALGFHYFLDVAFYPWAHPWTHGGETLLGGWTAAISTPKGESLLVYLHVEHSADEDHPPVEGTASVCHAGTLADDLLRGKPGWWGSTPMLRISAPLGTQGSPHDLSCRWTGAMLNCQIDFSRNYAPEAERVAAKAGIVHKWPPVAVQFRRGTRAAFEADCRSMAAR